MAIYTCSICETEFDETKEGTDWDRLPSDWTCHVCESGKSLWRITDDAVTSAPSEGSADVFPGPASVPEKTFDEFEAYMADIHIMSETGQSIIEPMRTRQPTFSWDDILIKGAQLSKVPLNLDQAVNTKTVIGPRAAHPM
jgi:rubredoxin